MTISTPFALKRNETTPFTRTFLDDIGAAAARTTLGLGSANTPTFSGVTLGVSGVLIGGTNRIDQRNGTNGQIFNLFKTYTSETNFHALTIDAVTDSSNYRVGFRKGSITSDAERRLSLGFYDSAAAWQRMIEFRHAPAGIGGDPNIQSQIIFQTLPSFNGELVIERSSDGVTGDAGPRIRSTNSLSITSFRAIGIASNGTDPIGLNPLSAGNVLVGTAVDNAIGRLQVNGTITAGTITLSTRFRIDKVYSSATSFERLEIDPATDAASYRIASRIGSLGGSIREISFGEYSGAGAWTQWLRLGPSGSVTINNLPTSDPLIAGRLWRSGNDLKISTG